MEENVIKGTISVGSLEDCDLGGQETRITLEDRVATLETDTADLAEALDMILSGVTE